MNDLDVSPIIRYVLGIYGADNLPEGQRKIVKAMAIELAGRLKQAAREFYLQKTDK